VPSNVARALIGGLKHDFAADDEELRRLVPQRLLDVREAIEAAFQAERQHRVAARWKEGAFPLRDFRHDIAYYAKSTGAEADSTAPPGAVWEQVTAIGGHNRYYSMNWLWTLREFMDWCLGGPGLSHGRRDPEQLRLGDAVDSWTTIGLEPGRRLTLKFGMKAPGAGVLEFDVGDRPGGGARVQVTTYWHPRGVWGLAYWYLLLPAHRLVLRGLSRAIVRRAEHAGRRPDQDGMIDRQTRG
jgi:hypothetical protein